MIEFTLFKSAYDNKTHRRNSCKTFGGFVSILQKMSKIPLESKKKAPTISPAIYLKDTVFRRNVNVSAWGGWCALDVDTHDYTSENLQQSIESFCEGYKYVCYSTASSTLEKPKFRLCFETDRYIDKDEIRNFWFALNSQFNSLGDKQCKDLSRMYFVPANYKNAYNFFFANLNGAPLNVSDLIKKHPNNESNSSAQSFLDRLPKDLQERVIAHRKKMVEVNSKKYQWSSYRDCPFVNKTVLNEYLSIANIDNTGRYSMIFKIMVSIALSAIKKDYPIEAHEIVELIRQIDLDTTNRYEKRALDVEANRAIEYAYKIG